MPVLARGRERLAAALELGCEPAHRPLVAALQDRAGERREHAVGARRLDPLEAEVDPRAAFRERLEDVRAAGPAPSAGACRLLGRRRRLRLDTSISIQSGGPGRGTSSSRAPTASRPRALPVDQHVVGERLVVGERVDVLVHPLGALRDVDRDRDRLHGALCIAVRCRSVNGFVSRGFSGRRRAPEDVGERLPRGQYVESGFPV